MRALNYRPDDGAVPAYLLDRKDKHAGKAISAQVKQKVKDKAAKYNVPLPKVRAQSENEVFREVKSGKRGKSWWVVQQFDHSDVMKPQCGPLRLMVPRFCPTKIEPISRGTMI